MTNLWSQALIDAAPTGSMVVTGTNPDGSFNVDISGYNEGEVLSDGNYLLITMIPNQDETAAKLIFSLFSYSAATGIFFGGAVASDPILADTGVSAWTAMVLAVAGAVAMVSGATLLVVRRRHALAG
jgi:LPXTG-motif cell wall-anchored protein